MQLHGYLAKRALTDAFPALYVLVVGDVMLDEYVVGTCDRISPESPVQVVRLRRRFSSLGGAANVAANFAALQVKVDLVGRLGLDPPADRIRDACASAGIGIRGLVSTGDVCTTVKTRVLAGDHQLLRIDEEDTAMAPTEASDAMLARIAELIDERLPDAVVISDYDKGVCTPYFCQVLLRRLASVGVPAYVDPKGRNYEKYRGARGITPNRAEIAELSLAMGWPSDDPVASAERLRATINLEFVAQTLGADGIALVSSDGVLRLPTAAKEVYDVSGAGDTVIATLVASLAAGLSQQDSVGLANAAAAQVVGHVGSKPIDRDELLLALQLGSRPETERKQYAAEELASIVELWKRQGLAVGFTNGCFDLLHAGHVRLLEDAASRVDRLIVAINSDDSVKRLKGPLRPLMSQQHRLTVLSALEAVDALVMFEEDTPLRLIETLKPNVLIKGGDYTRESIIGGDFVERHGGRVELVPLVAGVSTSHLAAAIEKL
jgi:D-beta-D-heptose 7-phosphate kinase/D-beta-D-heptose 1-phosphate adenosyltransferase